MIDYSNFLEVALRAAKEGGRVALSHSSSIVVINKQTHVGEFNPVTHADLEAEKVICDLIKKEFPSHCIIGEEGGSNKLVSEFSWHVDPIDGTNNYIRGILNWGVMIGACHNGEPVVGVIYHPSSGVIFQAAKGKGAFKNEEKIRVSNVEKLSEACTECPGYLRGENRSRVVEFFKKFLPIVRSYRHFGASALAFPMLAEGKLDLNIEENYQLHDVVPGVALVKEAGGVAVDFEGKEWNINSKGIIVASTKQLALEALQRLKDKS